MPAKITHFWTEDRLNAETGETVGYEFIRIVTDSGDIIVTSVGEAEKQGSWADLKRQYQALPDYTGKPEPERIVPKGKN